MATAAVDSAKEQNVAASDPLHGAVDSLAASLANVDIQSSEEKEHRPPRPLHIYTHAQLLWLSKSPQVKPPDGMPALKDWFGDWNEQQTLSKKESDSTNGSTNTRERRFRRDAEEGETPTRPSFRASLSQPSQMGNFRHQSLRTTDRDKDRDSERERQREERDREGQERLRNLSDKYDRDRMAANALRGKERESAPHLASSATRNGQGQTSTTARRTAEVREPAKKKPGEVSDDWRRGGEPRSGREDRSDTTRRDRRDTSRTRRDPSTTRRDRDTKERDRSRRRDERDDPRKDKDDYFPRRDWEEKDRDDGYRDRDRYDYGRSQRDLDRDLEDDPRRWRDDGKRDERIAARRDRESGRDRERGWDRWEPSHDRDRLDDRDGRSKRGGRDRRSGAGLDDGKEKDEKREREKEKEPAWMETYVPTTPGGGILGARSADGELDGIQAWKKSVKEKERKEKEAEQSADSTSKQAASTSDAVGTEVPAPASGDSALDEIQLFKLMMKREAAKKDTEPDQASPVPSSGSILGRSSPAKSKDLPAGPPGVGTPAVLSSDPAIAAVSTSSARASPSVAGENSRLFSLFAQASAEIPTSQPSKLSTPNIPPPDNLPPSVSRMFPTPPGLSPSLSQNPERPTVDLTNPSYPNTPFDPPAGSRLLAFGSRAGPPPNAPSRTLSAAEAGTLPFNNHLAAAAASGPGQRLPGVNALGAISAGAGMHQSDLVFSMESEAPMVPNPRATPSERSARSFSPFGQPHQPPFGMHDAPETMRLPQAEAMRRMQPSDRAGLGMGPDNSFVDLNAGPANFNPGSYEMGGNALGGASSAAKGSRFVKFFDKNREVQTNVGARKVSGGNGYVSTSPLPGQGRDGMNMNGMANTPAENRAMEDLFAMLQSSSQHQHHRASPGLNQTGRLSAAGAPFGQGPIDLQALQQQQLQQMHHQQQLAQQNRLDALYDSRLDDRNFVPDGMVPGLRMAPRPRSREPSGIHFNDHLDEPLQVNPRLAQQQRNLEQLYSGPGPNAFGQQGNLGRNIPAIQQNQFRGGPSVLPSQNLPQVPPQRLPPGLANLGGRPPHDASQFLNAQLNNLGPPHGGAHLSQQQSLNNFGGIGYNGPAGGRGGPMNGPHHNNPMAVNQLGGMGPGNGMDLRAHNQAQLLGLGAGGLGVNNGMGGGLRGAGVGFNGQPSSVAQLQAQQMALRQQQQQQQLQHLGMPPAHMLPPHLPQQQQQNMHANSQGAQDLMALLMGGQGE